MTKSSSFSVLNNAWKKEGFDIIRKSAVVEYPHGPETIDYECDLCHKSNYPVFTWKTDDDPYIRAFICAQCATDMMHTDAT